jgi:magnesium-protoporphyrin IX monomethyl ester (oxidative) cyclase
MPTLYEGVGDNRIADYCPPLSLGYLAASLQAAGHEARVFDTQGRDERLPALLTEYSPDVVGLSCMTTAYPAFARTVRLIREDAGYDGLLVGGGPHLMLEPRKTLAQLPLDVLVVTEGERILPQLVSRGPSPDIAGLYLPSGFTAPASALANLDSLPFPAHEEFEHDLYSSAYYPLMPMRGCPYQCSYCSSKWLWGNRVRTRSPENVAREMQHVYERLGFDSFFMYADTFVTSKRWIREFADRVADLPVRFRCNGRINLMTADLLADLKRAGCCRIDYGVETAVQSVADRIGKALQVSDVPRVIEATVRQGMHAHLYCMLSMPGETVDDMRETVRFAEKMRRRHGCSYTCQITRVFPGTPLAQEVALDHEDWTEILHPDLPYANVPMYPGVGLDREAVLKLWRRAGAGNEIRTIPLQARLRHGVSVLRGRIAARTRLRRLRERLPGRAEGASPGSPPTPPG